MEIETAPKPTTSIALCTFNGSRFLPEQLASFVNQTILPDELVICDDGSSDDTLEILAAFAASAPFRVSINRNRTRFGSTKNFEQAITLCGGEIIFLSDQDDVWAPYKVERTLSAFAAQPKISMFFSDGVLIDDRSQSMKRSLWDQTFPDEMRDWARNGDFFKALLWQNVVTGAAAAFRSNVRDKILPIPDDIPNMVHDAWIALVLAAENRVGMIEEPLIKYRVHSNQQLGVPLKKDRGLDHKERQQYYDFGVSFAEGEKIRFEKLRNLAGKIPALAKIEDYWAELSLRRDGVIRHYSSRRAMPMSRFKRLAPIVSELRSGRYHTYSRGYLSALKDLVEKW